MVNCSFCPELISQPEFGDWVSRVNEPTFLYAQQKIFNTFPDNILHVQFESSFRKCDYI